MVYRKGELTKAGRSGCTMVGAPGAWSECKVLQRRSSHLLMRSAQPLHRIGHFLR